MSLESLFNPQNIIDQNIKNAGQNSMDAQVAAQIAVIQEAHAGTYNIKGEAFQPEIIDSETQTEQITFGDVMDSMNKNEGESSFEYNKPRYTSEVTAYLDSIGVEVPAVLNHYAEDVSNGFSPVALADKVIAGLDLQTVNQQELRLQLIRIINQHVGILNALSDADYSSPMKTTNVYEFTVTSTDAQTQQIITVVIGVPPTPNGASAIAVTPL